MLHQDDSNKREKIKTKGVDFEDDLRDEVEDAVQKVCNATGCSVSICHAVTVVYRQALLCLVYLLVLWHPSSMLTPDGPKQTHDICSLISLCDTV